MASRPNRGRGQGRVVPAQLSAPTLPASEPVGLTAEQLAEVERQVRASGETLSLEVDVRKRLKELRATRATVRTVANDVCAQLEDKNAQLQTGASVRKLAERIAVLADAVEASLSSELRLSKLVARALDDSDDDPVAT